MLVHHLSRFTALTAFIFIGFTAQAQQTQSPMSCNGSSATPLNARSNGHAELVGDVVVTCTGGTPTAIGQPIPQGTIAIVLDTSITSRLLAPGWSEALLLVDEPTPATQVVCGNSSGVCNLQGNGTGLGTYDGNIGRANVYQGQPASSNEIDFVSVPLDPPGTNGTRTFRITNIRADASSTGSSGRISAQVSAIGPTISLNTGQVVANVSTPASFTAKSIQTGTSGITQFAITMTEKFANALRTRTTAASPGNSLAPTPATQASPGQSTPGSETGFYNPAYPSIAGRGNLSSAGLADSGTRVYLQISNPGSGITISANSGDSLTSGGILRLMNADATGAGSFSPQGTCCGAVALTPDASGSIRAVFEVLGADSTSIESVDLPFFVTYASGAPTLTSLSITAGLAPQNSSGPDLTSPLPRFSGTTSLSISASAASAPIQVSSTQLQFNAFQGGDSPGPQMVSITTGVTTQAAFSVVFDSGTQGSAAPSWLSNLRPPSVTPGTLIVYASTGTLPVGTQTARIRIVPKDTTQTEVDIPVSFTITAAAPQMDVSPRSLSFVSRAGVAGVLEQQLIVRNRGGGSVNFTASIVGGKTPGGVTWLTSVTPSSGQTAPNAPVLLRVDVNPQSLAAGVYSATIHIVSPASTTDIGVVLQVAAPGPILRLSTVGLRFQAIAGNTATRSQIVEVIDDGDPNSSVNYTADLLQGSDWLNVLNAQGSASAGKPGIITLAPKAAVSGFSAGVHYAVLRVTDANSQNSPQLLTAVLIVSPANTPPFPDPFPSGLVFSGTQASAQLGPGLVTINVSSSASVTYQATALTRDGGSWLSVTPPTGTTSSTNPAQLQVLVTPTGLAPGASTGDVTIAIGNVTRVVRVTLVVQAAATLTSNARAANTCAPSQLVLTDSAFADGSIVPTGAPALLTMLVNDNCDNAVTDASVVASFDNGDAPVTLLGDGTGAYTANWTPGRVASSVTINFTAIDANIPPPSAGVSAPATSVLRIGSVAANSIAPPVQAPGGTVNNLNPVLNAPLAPGTIASVYGSALASVAVGTGNAPLPNIFSGTQILVNGNPVPLFYVSPGQVNTELPLELSTNQKHSVLAFFNNIPAIPDSITIAPATPAILASGGAAFAQRADGSFVSSAAPAKPGEALVFYLIGMGATTPAVPTGQGTPQSPLSNVTLAPIVTLNGESVTPFFTGLTPFFVGLYQMNIIVPSDAQSGALPLTITQGNISANATTLLVAR